jgi:hypothetical protein
MVGKNGAFPPNRVAQVVARTDCRGVATDRRTAISAETSFFGTIVQLFAASGAKSCKRRRGFGELFPPGRRHTGDLNSQDPKLARLLQRRSQRQRLEDIHDLGLRAARVL